MPDRFDVDGILATVNLTEVVSRYRELSKQGSEYVCRCVAPGHDDINPSLSVSPQKGFVHCWSCGYHENAIGFLMTVENIDFKESCRRLTNGGTATLPPVIVQPQRTLAKAPPWRSMTPPADTAAGAMPDMVIGKLGAPSATWTYRTPDGSPYAYIARYDTDKGKEIRCFTYGQHSEAEPAKWACKHMAAARPLYNLHTLTARSSAQVLVVEGEKTADAAQLLFPGMVVTTWAGGSSATALTDWSPLAGRDVILVPDNDEPGRKAMLRVSVLLHQAKRVRGVNTEAMPPAWDLADADNWTPEAAIEWAKERLFTYPVTQDKDADIAAQQDAQHESIPLDAYSTQDVDRTQPHGANGKTAPRAATQPAEALPAPPAISAESLGVIYTRMSDVSMEPVSWLWKGKIAIGAVSMIQGDPGLGKSMLTASLAAVVTTGGLWPVTRDRAPMGSVIILSAEDSPKHTIAPRLEAAGADQSRIYKLDAIRKMDERGESTTATFDLSQDVTRLMVLMRQIGDVRLVIIDPASAYIGTTADSHKNSDVRGIMSVLSDAADRCGAAILIINHLNKSNTQNALMRGQGSVGWMAASRAVFGVAKDKADETGRRRFFLTLKNNLADDSQATNLAYSIESYQLTDTDPVITTSRILWEAQPVTQPVEEIFRADTPDNDKGAMADARAWLTEALANGPVRVQDLQVDARKSGHYWSTVRQVKNALGVVTRRIGGAGSGGASEWSLPTTPARSYASRED